MLRQYPWSLDYVGNAHTLLVAWTDVGRDSRKRRALNSSGHFIVLVAFPSWRNGNRVMLNRLMKMATIFHTNSSRCL